MKVEAVVEPALNKGTGLFLKNNHKIMSKKSIAVIVILLIVVIAAAFYAPQWWRIKQLKIQMGLANPSFPWLDYTQSQLDKMYPQIKNADVPTRTTPEQTYAKFREALKTNNLELALEQMDKESSRYQENKSSLEKSYKEGRFPKLYEEYPAEIKKESMYEAIAQFYFLKVEGEINLRQYLNFGKDSSGDWRLSNI